MSLPRAAKRVTAEGQRASQRGRATIYNQEVYPSSIGKCAFDSQLIRWSRRPTPAAQITDIPRFRVEVQNESFT